MSYVIVVEDNEIDFERIQRLSAKLNLAIDLRWARDGIEAMQLLRADDELPLGLIVDLNMPRMGGWELVAALGAQPPFDTLSVAVCTTSAHPNDLLLAREAGVSAYVVKPIEQEELLVILNGFTIKAKSGRRSSAAARAEES